MVNTENKYTVDFKDVEGIYDMFEILSTALKFPNYFGNNWDAFWDCITDINGLPLYIDIHSFNILKEKLSQEAECFLEILKQLKHYGNDKYYDITIIKIHDDGDTYFIE